MIFFAIKKPQFRSRSYEHIDEPDLSDNEDASNMSPIIVSREKDIVEIDREIINVTKRRNSAQTERRPAIILDHGTGIVIYIFDSTNLSVLINGVDN